MPWKLYYDNKTGENKRMKKTKFQVFIDSEIQKAIEFRLEELKSKNIEVTFSKVVTMFLKEAIKLDNNQST